LVSLGVKTISDGMSLYPYRDAQGVFWVPQQLWRFREAPFGVWTVCMHPKDELWMNAAFFRKCIRAHRANITDLATVTETYRNRGHSLMDSGFKDLWSLALQVKGILAARAARGRKLAAQIETEPSATHRLNAAR